MNEPERLIPPAPLVRERLARNIRERRLLRSLLRLSLRAADDRRPQTPHETRTEADGPGVAL